MVAVVGFILCTGYILQGRRISKNSDEEEIEVITHEWNGPRGNVPASALLPPPPFE